MATLIKTDSKCIGNDITDPDIVLLDLIMPGQSGVETLARILAIDPDAFVVISDTQEVINYRIGNQPHW